MYNHKSTNVLEFVDRCDLNTLSSLGLNQLLDHWSTSRTEDGIIRSSHAKSLLKAVFGLQSIAKNLRRRGNYGSLSGILYVPPGVSYELKTENVCSVDLGPNFSRVTKGLTGARSIRIENAIVFEFLGRENHL